MNTATTVAGETVRGVGTLSVYVGRADAVGYATCRVVPVPSEGPGASVWVRADAAEVAQYGAVRALAHAAADAWRESTRVPLGAAQELTAE